MTVRVGEGKEGDGGASAFAVVNVVRRHPMFKLTGYSKWQSMG